MERSKLRQSTPTLVIPEALRASEGGAGDTAENRGPRISAQLFVFDEGRTVWLEFQPETYCKNGRYAVRVRIDGGRIAEVWPVGAATSPVPQERLCAAGLISDLEVPDMEPGEYHAEVVVEPRPAGPR